MLYVCPPIEESQEQFFRVNLLLFHPRRDEASLSRSDNSHYGYYQALGNQEQEMIQRNASKYNKADIHHLFEMLCTVESENIDSMQLACDERNCLDRDQPSLSFSDEDFFRPSTAQDHFSRGDQVHDTTSQNASNSQVVDKIWSYDEYQSQYDMLNLNQRKIVDHVLTTVTSVKDHCGYLLPVVLVLGKQKYCKQFTKDYPGTLTWHKVVHPI